MVAAPIVALPAVASPDNTGVVINELYLKGGSANAYFNTKFIELYNPRSSTVSLDGWSLQSRSASNGNATVRALKGEIKAESYFLIGFPGNGTPPIGEDIPEVDLTIAFGPSGTTGIVLLANTVDAVPLTAGSVSDNPNSAIVDLIGYGAGVVFESAAATVSGGNGDPNSLTRTGFKDTDNNAADFSHQATVTPTNSSGETVERPKPTLPPEEVGVKTIAEIQGEGDASLLDGKIATTHGVVTAAYPTGGFNGYYIQTPGTGGAIDFVDHKASDGLFVYSSGTSTVDTVTVGDYLEITGTVTEYFGMTQITPGAAADVVVLTETVEPVTPAVVGLPETDLQRETLEGMLIAPAGDFTVTDTYSTNQYGEVKLAAGTTPLVQPTAVEAPGVAAYTAVMEANAARTVSLDDGASANLLTPANTTTPMPYVSNTEPVRVGAAVAFTQPVIFDYRNNAWKYQPIAQLTGANAPNVQPATFENTRQLTPEDVGGDLKLATFNVLNYFTTTGDVYTDANRGTCTTYNDRAGVPITVNRCTGKGPRGAATADSLKRQEDKIVSALNALDADVVGLEEIETTTAVGGTDRDAALNSLVAALNADAGSEVWSAVPSPATIPADEDVIRTAFIYKGAVAELVGGSTILNDSPAFSNAREPLAQAFKLKGAADADAFVAIVNHFKSKGSGSGAGNTDAGDGQGSSNADRVKQATALVAFANEMASVADTDKTFLLGDFNSYLMEDPITVLKDAGYIDQGSKTGKHSYSYGGMVGSLDYVFASPAADATVNDVDIWNINSGESIALEYSRFNYNVTDFYVADMFRASDHDPVIVGVNLAAVTWSPKITRIQGADRYATAINISRAGFRTAPIVFVVTGEDYPDALSAAPVAAVQGGPLLLTAKNSLPTAVANEIRRLNPSTIVVVGGYGAVSTNVLAELANIAPTQRVSGSDRYATSRNINTHARFGFTTAAKAYVATGQVFPDALSASAAGAAIGAPVILVNGSAKALDADTKSLLTKLEVTETIIAGGTGAVSAGIANGLQVATGTTPVRRGGSDRFETSRLIGSDVFAPAKSVYLATGMDYPDALAGAVLAGTNKGPLYLVQPTCVPKATLTAITTAAPVEVTLFGGPGALSNNVANLKACK